MRLGLGIAACAVLLASLGACGDAGTGPDALFRVLALLPADGDQDVPEDAAVLATFSRAVDPQTLTTDAFAVARIEEGGAARRIPGTLSFLNQGRTAHFAPIDGLANNAEYRVTIGTAVRDEDGESLASAVESSFRTLSIASLTVDPEGDTFGGEASPGLVLPDLLALLVSQDPDQLVFVMTFVEDVEPVPDSPNALLARIDLDIDQDPATGVPGQVDFFRPPGSGETGLGVEIGLGLDSQGEVEVFHLVSGTDLGVLQAEYGGRSVTVRVPYELLEDDGNVDVAAIVGTLPEPTDFAPNAGRLRVGAPGARLQLGPGRAAGSSGGRRGWGE